MLFSQELKVYQYMAVYNFSDNYFVNRLSNIGFKNYGLVLDAACGKGDWLPALAKLNKKVHAFDFAKSSLTEAKQLALKKGVTNTKIFSASMLSIPIKNNVFDAVFCFDSLMFVNPVHTLNEFKRILKPKGKVYISVNRPGWILKCFWERGILNRNLSKIFMSLRIIYDTFMRMLINYEIKVENTVYTKTNLERIAKKTGYKIIFIGYEGSYKNLDYEKYPACFEQKYLGIPVSIEAILEKHE